MSFWAARTPLATVEDVDRCWTTTSPSCPARSREVLRLRFEADLKQREIGKLLGISQMHVSRLIRQSLEQLAGGGEGRAGLPETA